MSSSGGAAPAMWVAPLVRFSRQSSGSRPSIGRRSARTSLGGNFSRHSTGTQRAGIRSVIVVVRHETTLPGGDGAETTDGADVLSIAPEDHVDASDSESIPGCSWPHAAFLIAADVAGTGVLAMPGAIRTLGLWPGCLVLSVCYLANHLVSVLISRLQWRHPTAVTMGDLGLILFGPVGGACGWIGVYVLIAMLLGNYVHSMALSLQIVFYNWDLQWEVVLAAVGAIVVLPAQARVLWQSYLVCILSGLTISAALALCVIRLAVTGCQEWDNPGDEGDGDGYPWGISLAISAMLFSLGGQKIFLEIIAEMEQPREFERALKYSLWALVGVYASFSFSVYGLCRDQTPLYALNAMPKDWSRVVVGALVLVHTLISYIIKHQVLGRAIHLMLDPARANALLLCHNGFWPAKLQWFGLSIVLLGFSFGVAYAVPSYNAIIALVCGALQTPLCIVFPIVCYLQSCRRYLSRLAKSRWALLILAVVSLASISAVCVVAACRILI